MLHLCEYCNYNLILCPTETHLLKILRSHQRFGGDCCFILQGCPEEHQQLNYPEVCRNNRIRNSGNYIPNHTASSQDKWDFQQQDCENVTSHTLLPQWECAIKRRNTEITPTSIITSTYFGVCRKRYYVPLRQPAWPWHHPLPFIKYVKQRETSPPTSHNSDVITLISTLYCRTFACYSLNSWQLGWQLSLMTKPRLFFVLER